MLRRAILSPYGNRRIETGHTEVLAQEDAVRTARHRRACGDLVRAAASRLGGARVRPGRVPGAVQRRGISAVACELLGGRVGCGAVPAVLRGIRRVLRPQARREQGRARYGRLPCRHGGCVHLLRGVFSVHRFVRAELLPLHLHPAHRLRCGRSRRRRGAAPGGARAARVLPGRRPGPDASAAGRRRGPVRRRARPVRAVRAGVGGGHAEAGRAVPRCWIGRCTRRRSRCSPPS